MNDDDVRSLWASEEAALASIGQSLYQVDTVLELSLPVELAAAAVRAWNRDDVAADLDLASETHEQTTTRHRAGSLALIGAAVERQGIDTYERVHVPLDSWLIGHALDAADDHGLIVGRPASHTPSVPSFVNVDLDVRSGESLSALHDHLAHETAIMNYVENEGGSFLSVELLDTYPTIGTTIEAMFDLVDDLPGAPHGEWLGAAERVFNIGIEAATGRSQPVIKLSADLVAGVVQRGGALVFTHYPNADRYDSFEHHPVE